MLTADCGVAKLTSIAPPTLSCTPGIPADNVETTFDWLNAEAPMLLAKTLELGHAVPKQENVTPG
jgi:hypothetical protein